MTKVFEKQIIEDGLVVDAICNLCKKSCILLGNIEALHCEAYWGYGTDRDLTEWQVDLCADCSKKFNDWLVSLGGHVDVRDTQVEMR